MNKPAMTIPEQALADFLSANSLVWIQGKTAGRWLSDAERDLILRAMCSPAPQSLVGVERPALPPLRAREEIAREVAKIVDEPLGDGALAACDYMGDEAAVDLRKAITRALSRPAGQEWRDISSAPNDSNFRWYGLHVQHTKGHAWFEAHYVSHDDDGQMVLPSGDNFDDWAFSDFEVWCDAPPLPAPPVAEPIVADKQTGAE